MLNSIKGLLNVNRNSNFAVNNCVNNPVSCNVNVGGTILKHYQDKWAELHEINERNAQTVSQLANDIENTSVVVKRRHECATEMLQLISPNLQAAVDNCVIQLKQLQVIFEETEKSLANLEDLTEVLELKRIKLQQENELAKYKQNKLGMFKFLCIKCT